MSKNHLLDLISGYESDSSSETKGKRFTSLEISGSVARRSPSRLSRKLAELSGGFVDMISYTSTRTFGLLFGSFGLLTLIIHFIMDYLGFVEELSPSVMLSGALLAVLGVPFLSFDKPCAIAMQELPLTDAIFFEFFCIQRMPKKQVELTLHPLVGLFLGIALAILGAFVPVTYVLLGMAVALYLFLTAISPEFSVFLIFLVMPYFPLMENSELILSGLVLVTLISFLRKTYQGKRIYHFEKYDLLILFMLLIVFVSGVIVGGIGSVVQSSMMLVIGYGGYVITGSLVANRRLADCVIAANIIASVPIALLSIVQFIFGVMRGGGFEGALGTFGSPNMLAAYLLVNSVFAVYFILARRHLAKKLAYGAILLLLALALVATMRPWLLVALVACVLSYLALKLGNISGLLLGAIAFLPYLILFLPTSWLTALADMKSLSYLGFSEYVSVWVESRGIFMDNLFLGVGTGDFMDAPNTANFLLQIALEAGVIVLFAFVLIFATRLQHRSIYGLYVKESEVRLITNFSDIAIIALLAYGLFTPIWSAPTVYYLFWCVFGLGSAVLRISKSEFDERVAYFSDGAGIDASSLDIYISKR